MRKTIIFYLNGKRHEVGADKASMMLAEYLRYDQSLTGTKVVCAEGDCGACSVLRYFPHGIKGTDTDHYIAINSCVALVAQLDGSSLVTVDALKKDNELHTAQKSMMICHGSQCGFCTPGFVIALTGLVEEKIARSETAISPNEAKNCTTGNLCRCTGYQPIINAAVSMDLQNTESVKKRFFSETQNADLNRVYEESVGLETPDFTFFAPKSLKEAFDFLKAHPDAKILASGTDLGVVHNKRKAKMTKLLSLHLVHDLYKIEEARGEIHLGARVTLTEFRHFIKNKVPEFAHYLDIFASPQIKNIATVIGNIANASPIGDTPPAFLALNATVKLVSEKGNREVPMSDFFLGYRKTAITPGEIISGLKFKLPRSTSDFKLYKNANRKDLDISAVNFAIKIDWKDQSKQEIDDVTIAGGGVGATPLRFKQTEQFLKNNKLSQATINDAVKILHSEFKPLSDLRASSAYRHVLVENYFRKVFKEVGGIV